MKILSLFDGCSGAMQALKMAGIKVSEYHAFEIDKYAIQISKKNYPEIIHHGDVTKASGMFGEGYFDLLIGGSPCQDLSIAGKRTGLSGGQSGLFWEYVKCLKVLKPKYFLLENVASMSIECMNIITDSLGVTPVFIDSYSLTAQKRQRLYWANWNFDPPLGPGPTLKDILEDLPDCPIGVKVREKSKCIRVGGRNSPVGSKQEWDSPFQRLTKKGTLKKGVEKSRCLTAGSHSGGNHSDMDIIHTELSTRRYSIIECERLQGMEDNFTEGVSNTRRYSMTGNGFTIPVIAHILKEVKRNAM